MSTIRYRTVQPLRSTHNPESAPQSSWMMIANLSRLSATFFLFFSIVKGIREQDVYTNHHGLAAAVAGPDFFILASDTRLAGNSGYDILERFHTQSRLWSTTDATMATGPDGSINVPVVSDFAAAPLSLVASFKSDASCSWVASVGCQSDCEHLKRFLRAQLRAARYFGEIPSVSAPTAAVALSNLLYSRRHFAYYSFCLVGGFDPSNNHVGQVYSYDAFGSYEAVATACAGNGQGLMQPILDRCFSSSYEDKSPSKHVDCSSPEVAVERLLAAYRAVSEREITVGDSIVFCCIQRKGSKDYETRIYTAPLKQH